MRPVTPEDRIVKKRRDMYHQGQRYPISVILKELKVLSPEEIAFSYSSSVLSLPKRHLLSYNGDPESVEYFKRKFQEETRISLYLLAQHLNVGKVPFSQLRPEYQRNVDKALEALHEGEKPSHERTPGIIFLRFQEGTIEKLVAEAISRESTSGLKEIYQALEKGSEEFMTENFRKEGRDNRYKEYNHVLRALREI
ncbi:MAG: hypothetical protein WCV90_05835 [Candidatus Woesearchaeota archaeon]|jgi:hypothetical protein